MKIFWQLRATPKYGHPKSPVDIHDARIHPTRGAAEKAISDFLDRVNKYYGEFSVCKVDGSDVDILELRLVEESAE